MTTFNLTHPFVPKSLVCLREGYDRPRLLGDVISGITVAIVALPLAMALAIASGVKPEQGLYTAIIAGFIISLLGGSRVQIGGPTGAFIVIVFNIVQHHGYDGLAIATLMAGVILILLGVFGFGTMIKYIPYPVTTGFTSGIAVLIFSSQVKDFLGLTLAENPAEFVPKWKAYFAAMGSTNWHALAIGAGSLVLIVAVRRLVPRIPGYLVAVIAAATVTALLHWDSRFGVETISSKFGELPRMLPRPALPNLPEGGLPALWAKMQELLPEAATIAMLAGIESLLCAVVADGMIGGRHKSNCELVAQGAANIGSVLFMGIPATGAIARTAANIKSGGRTPVAGMVHSITLLLFMMLLAPWAGMVPLAVLAAVLMVVAYNMAEIDHFRSLFRAPRSDILVLLTTFGLTVFADLTVAVGVGMVLAAMLFMKRMSDVTNFGAIRDAEESTDPHDNNLLARTDIPADVEVYEINGPFFFGVADRLKDTLRQLGRPPKVFILRMRRVPAIDATGMHALEEFWHKCSRQHTRLLLSGVHAQPMFALRNYGLIDRIGEENLVGELEDALAEARRHLAKGRTPSPL